MYRGKPDIYLIQYGGLTKMRQQLHEGNTAVHVWFLLAHPFVHDRTCPTLVWIFLQPFFFFDCSFLHPLNLFQAGGEPQVRRFCLLYVLCLYMSQLILHLCSEMIQSEWGSSEHCFLPVCFHWEQYHRTHNTGAIMYCSLRQMICCCLQLHPEL